MSDALAAYLCREAERCIRPPRERFAHPWLSPMPPPDAIARDGTDDRFSLGDYSLGLFHHDVSEAAIALAPRGGALRDACLGSLLCFFDCASDDGNIHRTETPHAVRDREPAKPVMAQLALRVIDAMGEAGLERVEEHHMLEKLLAFYAYCERTHTGPNGLMLTPSSRASGYDNDPASAGYPERSVEGPDTNAFFVLDYRAAAEIARRVGRDRDAASLEERAAALAHHLDTRLYYEDERGGFYGALRGDRFVLHRDPDGVARPMQTWIGFLPLYAGIPSRERAASLARRLLDERAYFGPCGVRTVPADSPFFQQAARAMLYDPRRGEPGPVSNWAGPIWTLASYYMARGLERYGFEDHARVLDERTVALLAGDLARTGVLHECYDDEGRGLWPRRGTFVSWNVLALTLLDRGGDPVMRLPSF
jgi:putative isomerase